MSAHGYPSKLFTNMGAHFSRSYQVAGSPRTGQRGVVAALVFAMCLISGGGQCVGQTADTATVAASTPVPAATQQGTVHIVPFGRATPGAIKNAAAPAGAHLTYWGGPVISHVHVVAVFWGTNVNTATTTGIGQFFTDFTNSNFFDLLTEYSTVGVLGAGTPAVSTNQFIVRGNFDTAVTITPAVACVVPCTLTDAQIQTELAAQITAGKLPVPVADASGNVESIYMIYFPPGISISLGPAASCVSGGFCAYHSNTPSGLSPGLVPYGVMPDMFPPSGCSIGCGSSVNPFQNLTAVTSHELAEAVTDALVGSASVNGPPLAWYDPTPSTNPLGEIGDICNGLDVNIPVGANTYSVQQEFSNLQGDCVSGPPTFNLTPPSASLPPAVQFNLQVTLQSSAGFGPLGNYTGKIHFTSSDAAAVLPADYTFTTTDAGTHSFPVTLNTLGNQTITVRDVISTGFTGSTTINVNLTPDLVITKSHVGNFVAGQTGTYTITVSNSGSGPTAGTITVADVVPAGLTASTIGGTGWACVLGTVTCTRSDALARASSYPAINLVVNVIGPAPGSVANTVTVSGGGETNTLNDSATDITHISGPDVTVGIASGIFFQGATAATYTLFPGNSGDLPTAGVVTVQDTISAGFTATAISGVGWTCTLANLTCTRADSLPASTAFPVILITGDVALNAPATLTNSATISGGGETLTANDTAQDVSTVGAPRVPDITVAVTHAGNFVQGQTGVYSVQVSNAGLGSSSGIISVTVTLPPSLTATSLSGLIWNCTLATLTCTRNDSLGGGIFASTITLNVNVAANAPASVIASATVSGGGDTNPANNTANDTTIISPANTPDLTISKAHTGNFLQGSAESYTLTVSNIGTGPTTGVVTVSDGLPAGLTGTSVSGTGWTCSAATAVPVTCTRSDPLALGSAYPAITLAVNVAANAPTAVTNTATVAGGGEVNTANDSASDPTTVIAGVTDLVATGPTPPIVFVGDTGQLLRFIVTNKGNLPSIGTVTATTSASTGLTVTSMSGTGWNCTLATLTCTRADSLGANFGFPEIDIRVSVAINAPSTATVALTVAGGGDSAPGNNTFAASFTINGPATINIPASSGNTIAGQNFAIPMSVSLAPAAGSATFSCTGLPAAAACSFNPASITSTSASLVSLTITTTARGGSAPIRFRTPPGGPTVVLFVLVLLGLLVFIYQPRRAKSTRLRPVLGAGLACALILAAMAGCGGGNKAVVAPTPTPTPIPGTPAGAFTVIITATTPIGTSTTPFNLTVQ
jgi:uncharacterized repeat protein (TIGR01451 family)